MKTVIVHGPQGCGKTVHGEQLRTFFGCSAVIELDEPGQRLTPGALHLTNHLTNVVPRPTVGAQIMSFKQAMATAQIKPKRFK